MKRLRYYFLLLWVLLAVACNESLEEEEVTVSEEPNTDLAFELYGFRTVSLVSIYDEYVHTFEMNYEGTEDLTVSLVVDTAALEQYNDLYEKNYDILPLEYYDMPGEVILTKGFSSLSVTFHTAEIIQNIGIDDASKYVLPISARAKQGSIILNSRMSQALLHVQVDEPTLTIADREVAVFMADSIDTVSISLTGNYNFEGMDTSQISLEIREDDVEYYNNTHGTSHTILPADNYSYKGMTLDEEKKQLTFDFLVKRDEILADTYVLPLRITSDLYAINAYSRIFHVITIESTAVEYLTTYDLSVTETVDNGYITTAVQFDFTAAASALGITEDELKDGISFYGINSDESLYASGYTANTGYWYDKNGDVCSWGATDCALFVEYGADGIFNVGQFPDATAAWDTYTVALALVYQDVLIRYNITLNVIPEYLATYDLSVTEESDDTYASTAIQFDFAAAVSTLGITEDELRSGIAFYGINADGSLATSGYTANTGYWYDKNGDVCSWGATDCALYVEYGADGIFNVGQFPDATATGDTYTVSLALVYEDQLIRYNVTVNIN